MRITRAPLRREENLAILKDYNRLTGAEIPLEEFERWLRDSPEGAAWHALLETEEGKIVGHTSVFPVRTAYTKTRLIPAMSEYSYVHEDFRKEKIKGYEKISRPAFIILLGQLFQHVQDQGWGPIFASTNEKNQIFTRKVGLRPAEFPLRECLLILRPAKAARHTPNLSAKQRLAFFTAGLGQGSLWAAGRILPKGKNSIRRIPIGAAALTGEANRLSFFQDNESLRWRYLEEQYAFFSSDDAVGDYVVAKRGSDKRFLRVCQYRLSSAANVYPMFRALLKCAYQDGAMGVRWAVYDEGEISHEIVRQLQRLGFLTPRRVRIVMVHNNFPEFLQPSMWHMQDAHFCYDP